VKYGPARARYERRKRRRQMLAAYAGLWNFLSVILGIATVILGGWFVWKIGFEPSPVQSVAIPTVAATIYIEPTQKNNVVVTEEPTPHITFEPIPTVTDTAIPTPTIEDESNYVFDIQAKPESISATLFKADSTCNWSGIAGQAFDLQGRPIPGITVQVTGPLYGKDIKYLSITGSASIYGPGGYEIFLTDKPQDTRNEYEIRLVDQTGRGLSPRFPFDTSSDCSKNLVIVNFKQIK